MAPPTGKKTTPNKKKAKLTPQKRDGDFQGNPERTTASRKLGVQYECEHPTRIHAFEYGDQVVFPCGAESIIQDHTAKCKHDGCDAHRFIMDTWQRKLDDSYGEGEEEPPPLTLAGINKVLKIMGSNHSEVKRMPDSWDPSQPILFFDQTMNKYVPHRKTFFEIWDELSHSEQNFCLRPALPMPSWRLMSKTQGGVAPLIHRQFNTHVEAMEYVLKTAVADGVLKQQYINVVLEQYGIFKKPPSYVPHTAVSQGLFKNCQAIAAIDMEEAFQQFQFGTGHQANMSVTYDNLQYSPYAMLEKETRTGEDEDDEIVNIVTDAERKSQKARTIVEAERNLHGAQPTPQIVQRFVERSRENTTACRILKWTDK